MPSNIQLLKQIRKAVAAIREQTDNPEHLALADGACAAVNELMLQEQPGFYVDYFNQGLALLEEGAGLLPAANAAGEFSPGLPKLTGNYRPDVISRLTGQLMERLAAVVRELVGTNSPEITGYLQRITAWEEKLYLQRLQQAPASVNPGSKITQSALRDYLVDKFPEWKNLQVTHFEALDGGFSKKTVMFETTDDLNGKQSLVIRAEQPMPLLFYEGSKVTREFPMIRYMENQGIPVAKPLWLEDDAGKLGVRFIISRKGDGKNYGGNISTEPLSEALLKDYLDVLARLHAIKPDPEDPLVKDSHLWEWLNFKTLKENTQFYVSTYLRRQAELAGVQLTPQLELAINWLEKNIPDSDEPPVIVHLDYALNNLLIRDEKVTAVLDWESSRLGDPAEELMHSHAALSQFLSMERLLQLYKAGTGREISQFRLKYFKLANLVITAVCILRAEKMLNEHDDANINLCKLALPYSGIFMTGINRMIAEAEASRNS